MVFIPDRPKGVNMSIKRLANESKFIRQFKINDLILWPPK